MHYIQKLHRYASTALCFGIVAGFFVSTVQAQAIPSFDLNGYVWSSNIGWISLNCSNEGGCGVSDYKVTINADRTITGWGWSSNIGWIKFGGLSGFPVGSGTMATNTVLTGSFPDLTLNGWARACSATVGGDCSSMATATSSIDWDGWISMNGTDHATIFNFFDGKIEDNSFAWGSTVVGWINMASNVNFPTTRPSFSGTGCRIALNQNTCVARLTWNIPFAYPDPHIWFSSGGYRLSSSTAETNFPVTIEEGRNYYKVRSGNKILMLPDITATCDIGLVFDGSMCILSTTTPPAIINFSAQPQFVRMNNNTNISWEISTLAGSICTVAGPNLNHSILTETGTISVGPVRSMNTYRINCTGAYGTVEQRITIEVVPIAIEV